jgi:hypothetical protein
MKENYVTYFREYLMDTVKNKDKQSKGELTKKRGSLMDI